MKIQELKNNLFIGDYGDNITNYNGNTYICDAIAEIADCNTSIYYSDIKNFISNNVEAVENAINEFGWDGCGSDLMKAGQMGEFVQIEQDLYNNLENILLYYAYEYLSNAMDIDEITDEINKKIIDECSDIDHNNQFDAIIELLHNIFNEKEEESNV